MKAVPAFLAGVLLSAAIFSAVPAYAGDVEIRCAPVSIPRCENALKMRLERGVVPNGCKIS